MRPRWIVLVGDYSYSRWRRALRFMARSFLIPEVFRIALNYFEVTPPRAVRKLSRDVDLVLTSGSENLVKSVELGKPIVFRSLGSDLTSSPFRLDNLQYAYLSRRIQQALRRVDKVIVYQQDMKWSARFLGILDKTWEYSLPVDYDLFNTERFVTARANFLKTLRNMKFVIFLPARKNCNNNIPIYKGADKVVEALSQCPKEILNYIRVISIDHGSDNIAFRRDVIKAGLSEIFEHVSQQRLPELAAYMSLYNVITINDVGFKKGHLTGVARECAAAGGILIDSVNQKSSDFLNFYKGCSPSIFYANTPSEIQARIVELFEMTPEQVSRIRAAGEQWALENLSWQSNILDLEEFLRESSRRSVSANPVSE